MEFRNEPNVKQEWQLNKIVIVTSVLSALIAIGFFVLNNLYPTADIKAASTDGTYFELNGSSKDNSVQKILDIVADGDTLDITEKFVITNEFKTLAEKNIVILVNGYFAWEVEYPLYLGKEAKFVVGKNGELITSEKICNDKTSIQFGGKKIASCNGKDANYSFEEVMKVGGIDINGEIQKSKTYSLSGYSTDKENEASYKAAKDGDTIKITGKFILAESLKDLADKEVIILVENGYLIWEKEYALYLNKASKILLGKKGSLYADESSCNGKMFVYFESTEMASCNGDNAKYSFAEVNKSGGVSYEGLTALPVQLIRFDVFNNESNNSLKWATASEMNNKYFEIEKSENGKEWIVIGKVAGKGTTQQISNYSFIDNAHSNSQVVYYRLKQTDFDGKFEYSFVRSLVFNKVSKKLSSIYPNPATNFVNVKLDVVRPCDVSIISQSGEIKYQQTLNELVVTIELSAFTNGIYYVVIQNDQIKETHKLIVRK